MTPKDIEEVVGLAAEVASEAYNVVTSIVESVRESDRTKLFARLSAARDALKGVQQDTADAHAADVATTQAVIDAAEGKK